VLWIINAVTFLFITGFALLIDTGTARRSWRQAVMFPGAVNLAIILYTCFPRLLTDATHWFFDHSGLPPPPVSSVIVFVYGWLGGSLAVAYLAKAAEPKWAGRLVSPLIVYIVGYGSVLCACTFASYVKELRRAEMRWDKTEKIGKMRIRG
jgi:hypothetical protein